MKKSVTQTVRHERFVSRSSDRLLCLGMWMGGRVDGGEFVRRVAVLIRALGVYGKLPDQDALLMLG